MRDLTNDAYLDVPKSVAGLLALPYAAIGNGGALIYLSVGRVYNVLVKGQYRSVKRYGYRVPRWM